MGAQAVRLTNVDIDNALKNNHFEVIFQPIYRLSDGALLRMESFVRWVHPGLGVLPPGAFISFFENQGRMSELTRYVLNAALARYTEWRGTKGPGFSINIAHSDITDKSFPKWLEEVLAANDFPAQLVTLECPNPPQEMPVEEAQAAFGALAKTGANLAIEVRGRANDFLREASPFPFAEVKTGGSAILRFARTVRGGPGLTAISELLELAKANGARTVAVGVEDQASLQALASLGFEAAQGNYLAGVGDIKSFALTSVNEVRSSLSLPPLSQEELLATIDDAEADSPVENAPSTEGQSESDTPAKDLTSREDKLRAVKLKALQKKKAAQLAAQQRTAKKAADAKATAEKAQEELEAKRKALAEAEAARTAEENARKLQDRLSAEFEQETKNETTQEDGSARKDDSATAGLLLGGSLASSALGHTRPSVSEEDTDENTASEDEDILELEMPEEKPAKGKDTDTEETDDIDVPVAKTTQPNDDPVLIPEDDDPVLIADEIETDSVIQAAQAPEVDETLPLDNDLLQKSYSSGLTLMGIQKATTVASDGAGTQERLDEFDLPQDQELEIETFEEVTDLVVEMGESEDCPDLSHNTQTMQGAVTTSSDPITDIEAAALAEDFRSEDEVLDEAFHGAPVLDPTAHHPTQHDEEGDLTVDSSEAGLARKLAETAPTRRRQKNFLTRKYKIMPTHFWPRSWKRRWQATFAPADDGF